MGRPIAAVLLSILMTACAGTPPTERSPAPLPRPIDAIGEVSALIDGLPVRWWVVEGIHPDDPYRSVSSWSQDGESMHFGIVLHAPGNDATAPAVGVLVFAIDGAGAVGDRRFDYFPGGFGSGSEYMSYDEDIVINVQSVVRDGDRYTLSGTFEGALTEIVEDSSQQYLQTADTTVVGGVFSVSLGAGN